MAWWLPEDDRTPPPFDRADEFVSDADVDGKVHERDITSPLGRPTDDTGIGAEIALAEVENSIGYIVGRRWAYPAGRA